MQFKKLTQIRPHFLFILFLSACVSSGHNADFDRQQAAKARVELAIGYLNQQAWSQAKLNLDKALSYAPDYYLVHSAFAYFYQQQGDVELAQKAYIKAIDLDKNQGDVHNNYGAFLCSQGEFDNAYSQFQAALASPQYYQQADTYENLVLCAYSQNNLARAQENLLQLEKISPQRAAQLKSMLK
ncbi:type IV pilus assembly protein PilF [Pasteurella langaaensis DSM 22999]|uniref:Type IV pilus assembly protein PilF n=1 Tax=Alitibacter langaaensis DSM 22999 TaxID=1122935 RepID=A0A2U0T5B3_9PAST|nr:type IV pilus biogenesis/stability protein PilW [Pasteurella langaaensis]PVX38789.1 type IV pilus assembly protein PilF [Pasteurella langaaensis DSM 22999]